MASSIIPVKSSILAGYAYDIKGHILTVRFNNGTEHEYYNVFPPVISQVFDTPGSIGSKFIKLIRSGSYRTEKIR
jgi:hypothetical protein